MAKIGFSVSSEKKSFNKLFDRLLDRDFDRPTRFRFVSPDAGFLFENPLTLTFEVICWSRLDPIDKRLLLLQMPGVDKY